MKKVFLCTPHKLGQLNYELIERITNLGFEVLCAVTHSPQDVPHAQMFETNISLIKQSDIFVAVLKDYGKDLTFEVGLAYGWNKPTIGINYNAVESDVMTFYALDSIIEPSDLEKTLEGFK